MRCNNHGFRIHVSMCTLAYNKHGAIEIMVSRFNFYCFLEWGCINEKNPVHELWSSTLYCFFHSFSYTWLPVLSNVVEIPTMIEDLSGWITFFFPLICFKPFFFSPCTTPPPPNKHTHTFWERWLHLFCLTLLKHWWLYICLFFCFHKKWTMDGLDWCCKGMCYHATWFI